MYDIGVISDIHANIYALDAVLEHMKDKYSPKEIFCVGDLVNYTPFPKETIDRIRNEPLITTIVKGNHDHAAGIGIDLEIMTKFNPYAQITLRYTIKNLPDEYRKWLYQLPAEQTKLVKYKRNKERKITLIHGSLNHPLDEYILPNDEQIPSYFSLMNEFTDSDILLHGHTHIPFIIKNDKKETKKDLMIINPGSVGIPRDGDWRASYTVIDIKNMDARNERVEYDVQKVVDMIYQKKWPKYYAERLIEGK